MAVPISAALVSAVELLDYCARIPERDAGYVALCTGLALGAAGLVAALAATFSLSPGLALAGWVGLYGALALDPWAGLGMAAATGLVASHRRPAGVVSRAVAVGFALAAVLVFWPAAAPNLPLPGAPLLRQGLVPAAVYLLLGLGVVSASGLRSRRRWMPGTPALAGLLLGVLLAASYGTGRGHPDRNMPGYGAAPGAETAATILLLILDTVGAQHLPMYGYARQTTPRLTEFLARSDRAVLYPLAHSPATWTFPAHASLFTGTLPSEHGLHEGTLFAGDGLRLRPMRSKRTLAELLRAQGYRTAAILANFSLVHLPGLERGFDWTVAPLASAALPGLGETLRQRLTPSWHAKYAFGMPTARAINERVLRFLSACEPAPCFVVANYMEAHAPYVPAPPHAGTFATGEATELGPAKIWHDPQTMQALVDRYDEEILGLDAALGELIDALRARKVLDDLWLVITSDHGEAFGEHGVTEHGTTVYGEVTQIPLLIQPPRGVRLPPEPGAVSLLDVAATLGAVGGGESLGIGRDLRRPAAGEPEAQIEFFGHRVRKVEDFGRLTAEPARAVIQGDVKLIEQAGGIEVYRLAGDPYERHDRFDLERTLAERLRGRLPALDAGSGPASRVSPEAERALRALGYVR